jgi:hypothetical protein
LGNYISNHGLNKIYINYIDSHQRLYDNKIQIIAYWIKKYIFNFNYLLLLKMSNSNKLYDWDAVAWFSGFLYQADIALLKTLEKIYELLDDKNELEKWCLEIEWEEDFTLIKRDNWQIIEKHLYQVKEYEKWTPWLYLDWIIKLFQCTIADFNNNIKCKTYICSKTKINAKNLDKLVQKLIDSKGRDIWLQKCKSKIEWISNLDIVLEKSNSDIIDFYIKNKDWINKSFKSKFNSTDFIDNFDFWNINWFWNFDIVRNEVIILLWKIKPWINEWDYFFKFFESKIKRNIQENKLKIQSERVKINIIDIYNDIIKNDINCLTNIDYQDLYLNEFMKKFNEEFEKFYEYWSNSYVDNIPKIMEELSTEYPNFLDSLRKNISTWIFINKFKLINFIKLTYGTSIINWIDNLLSFVDLTSYSHKISYLNETKIKNKIILLINLYLLHNKWLLTIKTSNSFSEIITNENEWIITWINWDESDFIELFISDISIIYERKYIWVLWKSWTVTNIISKIWKDFLNSPKWIEIKEKFEKNGSNVTNWNLISIFCGKCSLIWKEGLYMTDHCKTINCDKCNYS